MAYCFLSCLLFLMLGVGNLSAAEAKQLRLQEVCILSENYLALVVHDFSNKGFCLSEARLQETGGWKLTWDSALLDSDFMLPLLNKRTQVFVVLVDAEGNARLLSTYPSPDPNKARHYPATRSKGASIILQSCLASSACLASLVNDFESKGFSISSALSEWNGGWTITWKRNVPERPCAQDCMLTTCLTTLVDPEGRARLVSGLLSEAAPQASEL